eukprot:gnl/TRDRNA2_/TRDRNA2_168341_c0_seq1.p1 gnl/TRDRNA2_/TRDRNA2_168341_c0~~gnl/TRDRNA2_/TRDRNA2_168341_c0_seq1.p1  ORF type:complete len:487 (-),score=83.40 gnl/TRDRNA2_/TRDRNA2_168341_c0_seq1:1028-2488(-)
MSRALAAIRESCKTTPELRSEDNVNDILEFVKDVKFFTKLTVLQQRTLCRMMSMEVFGPREYVFQIGEYGEKFYIILTGSVGVQVPSTTAPCPTGTHPGHCDCEGKPLETVVFLERGMGFGELALQSDQPRSATIQTTERTELLVTKKADYEMYAGQLHRQFIEQRVKFLRQCTRIEDALHKCLVSTQDIAAMANCLNEASLSGNTVAIRQGDVVDHMIFVRSGSLAMLRAVDLEPPAGASRKSISGKARQDDMTNTKDAAPLGPTAGMVKAMWEMKKKERLRRAQLSGVDEGETLEDVCVDRNSAETLTDASTKPQGETSAPAARGSLSGPRVSKLWGTVKRAVKLSGHMERFASASKEVVSETVKTDDTSAGIEAAQKSIEQFSSVQAARRKVAQYAASNHSRSGKKSGDEGSIVGHQYQEQGPSSAFSLGCWFELTRLHKVHHCRDQPKEAAEVAPNRHYRTFRIFWRQAGMLERCVSGDFVE